MHQTSGRWKLGLLLSVITSITWGSLPLILKGVTEQMDPITITWYRYLVAGLIIFAFLTYNRALPDIRKLKGGVLWLTVVCILGLVLNYNLYVLGLANITPSSAQVMIQFAPMLLLLGGIFIYREKLTAIQWIGFVVFVVGIFLFFNQRLHEVFQSLTSYGLGLFWILLAAITWAIYALAQKQLLKVYGSGGINLFIYLSGAIIMLPFAHPLSVMEMTNLGLFLLLASCLNTVVGYGAFAEALNHWEASRVSAVLAIQPLFTILFMRILDKIAPDFLPVEELNIWSFVGAFMVITGSMATALYRHNKKVTATSMTR